MENEKYIFTTNELNEILESEKKVIIYGAGDYGRRIADYIIFVGKQAKIDSFWVTDKRTEHEYRGINIIGAGEGQLTGAKDSLIIIAVSLKYLLEIAEIVQQYGRPYRCVTLELYIQLGRKLISGLPPEKLTGYEKLDFLLAGFAKCGTTSLHRALLRVDDIYLSQKKESAFFTWCDKVEDPKGMLVKEYFNHILNGQIVGMIEPTFMGKAEQIWRLFGKQVKILFLVRNPVNAVFSYFKMFSRGRNAMLLHDAYRQSGGVCTEDTFEYFFEQCKGQKGVVNVYRYIDWIRQFLMYYPRTQIKIILFEEMIENSREVVNDILRFVGSSAEYTCDDLPWVNEGNYAMADVEGLEIAERYEKMLFEYEYLAENSKKNREELFDRLLKMAKQYQTSKKTYDLRMSENLRRKLEAHYDDSVRELEKLLDRDLSQIWF